MSSALLRGMPSRLQYCVHVLLSMHDGDLYVGFILRETLKSHVWD